MQSQRDNRHSATPEEQASGKESCMDQDTMSYSKTDTDYQMLTKVIKHTKANIYLK